MGSWVKMFSQTVHHRPGPVHLVSEPGYCKKARTPGSESANFRWRKPAISWIQIPQVFWVAACLIVYIV